MYGWSEFLKEMKGYYKVMKKEVVRDPHSGYAEDGGGGGQVSEAGSSNRQEGGGSAGSSRSTPSAQLLQLPHCSSSSSCGTNSGQRSTHVVPSTQVLWCDFASPPAIALVRSRLQNPTLSSATAAVAG